jgi:non-specific serine/threonine protein kinase/serine/threonine-protein kinase
LSLRITTEQSNVPSPEHWNTVKALLDEVIELAPAARERMLRRLTANADVLAELRSLLAASDASGAFLTSPPALHEPDAPPSYRSLAAGAQIGAFRVEDMIGRGGQGEVYRAVRVDGHFDQHVALKLLRPEAVGQIARFQAERQILAGFDHPNIARLIDGGITPDGRPYMAMEFVTGDSITVYCQTHNPDLAARLLLFHQICDAVAYAQRNFVIHRDLKPGNILVTPEGQVKLLDFGIAHTLAGVSDTAQTEAALSLGYAAPEQLEGLRPTTATDVYALGTVLFEMLTGRGPWSDGPQGLPVTLRVLTEDAPLPSHVAAVMPSPPVPARALRGDLDAIVAKAMRRVPAERYENASALWDDVARHLAFQPVHARAGNTAYRARRFVRRNRWPLAAAASVMLAIFATTGGVAWQARQTVLQRDAARAEAARAGAVRDYVMLMFRSAGESGGPIGGTAKQLLDQTAQHLARGLDGNHKANARILPVLGELYGEMDDFESAATLLNKYLKLAGPEQDAADIAAARQSLAAMELRRGHLASATGLLRDAQNFWDTDADRYQRQLSEAEAVEATIWRESGRRDDAIDLLRGGLGRIALLYGADSGEAATRHHNLGVHLLEINRLDEAEGEFNEAWRALLAQGRERSVIGIAVLNHRAGLAYRRQQLDAAETMWREAIALRRDLYGPSSALAILQMNLGRLLLQRERPADGLPLLDDALAMAVNFAGEKSVQTIALRNSRAVALIMLDRPDEAEAEVQRALAAAEASFGLRHPYYAMSITTRGRLRMKQGRFDEALADLTAAKTVLAAAGASATAMQEEAEALSGILRDAQAKPPEAIQPSP